MDLIFYKKHGYPDRLAYLESLADEYGRPLQEVQDLADLLGHEEDFDGLVSTLRDD